MGGIQGGEGLRVQQGDRTEWGGAVRFGEYKTEIKRRKWKERAGRRGEREKQRQRDLSTKKMDKRQKGKGLAMESLVEWGPLRGVIFHLLFCRAGLWAGVGYWV